MADPVKRTPAKKAPARKTAPAKKAPAAMAPVKKAPARKAAPVKKAPAKKAPGKKSPARTAARGKTAASAVESNFFQRATERARQIANDPAKLREIAENANRSSALRSGPFAAVLDDVRALIRLVVAYARGLYRDIAIDKLIVLVAGLIYVVSPVDAIPDAVPVAGFLDDAAVIGWVIKSVRSELDAFREWEAGVTD